jgi:hypothetical protein
VLKIPIETKIGYLTEYEVAEEADKAKAMTLIKNFVAWAKDEIANGGCPLEYPEAYFEPSPLTRAPTIGVAEERQRELAIRWGVCLDGHVVNPLFGEAIEQLLQRITILEQGLKVHLRADHGYL